MLHDLKHQNINHILLLTYLLSVNVLNEKYKSICNLKVTYFCNSVMRFKI